MKDSTKTRNSLPLELAGEPVRLLADRALFWPHGETLFIADPHFGKGTAFRKLGIAVPDDTEMELARLSGLLETTHARQLMVLGDFLHARSGATGRLFEQLGRWRSRHAAVTMRLVEGNHDRDAGPLPPELNIVTAIHPVDCGPFTCRHEPEEVPGRHVLAGHVHPAISLRDRNGTRLRSPCFWIRPQLTVLPAFGSFTGTEIVQPALEDRVIVVGGGSLLPVPPSTDEG